MTKINWKKEARLLPGYLIVLVWVAFTAVMLCWIVGAVSGGDTLSAEYHVV